MRSHYIRHKDNSHNACTLLEVMSSQLLQENSQNQRRTYAFYMAYVRNDSCHVRKCLQNDIHSAFKSSRTKAIKTKKKGGGYFFLFIKSK
jgi:hypothetical protein